MVWFKVDDNMPDHQKVRSIPRRQRCAAVGLWTLAGAWCSRHLKDGALPDHMIEELAGTHALASALVAAGLWHGPGHDCGKCPQVPDGAHQFHDWRGSNPTKAKVEAKREADRERLRKWREKHAGNGVTPDVANGVGNTAPDPTRPDPTRSSSYEEGERPETLRAVPATEHPEDEEHCTRHPDGNPTNESCRGCQRVEERKQRRVERETDKRQREAKARELGCDRCDGANEVDPDTKLPTRRKCDHTRAAS